MQYFIKIFIILLLTNVHYLGLAQCLNVEISVHDVKTQKEIVGASFWTSNGIKRNPLGKIATGTPTTIAIPCDAKTLLVEATGYRPLSISLNIDASKTDKTNWILPILMVENDQQVSDKPYSQQEQTFFELKDSTKKGVPYAIRNFKVVDAITQMPQKASVCLYYTKSLQKNCFEIAQSESKEITFQEKDIIALEVKSPNYQAFNGNIIVDKLDGQRNLYEIKLSKELTILSLAFEEFPKPFDCLLTAGGKPITLKKSSNDRYYAYTDIDKTHQLRVFSEQRELVFEENLNLKKGINTNLIKLKIPKEIKPTPPPPRLNINNTPPPVENSILKKEEEEEKPNPLIIREKYILLFNQSDFRLLKDAEKTLEQLSKFLLQNPKSFARIVGHSDNVGNITQNQRLSELRTMVVKNFLSAKGIDEKRFYTLGLGSKKAISPNDTEENKAKNRRVEIQLIE
jgi:outer membrane protein OmpA-like peptidoglycan-associated protein